MTSLRQRAITAALALLIVACSGDSRPFEEAVEVQSLDLAELEVRPPSAEIEPLFIASNDAVQFSISGTTTGGGPVEVSSDDRQWRVSDGSVAGIDRDGRLVARSPGQVDVSVDIGGIESDPYSLTVSDAALSAIQEIRGRASLDPCRAEEYSASGTFDDGSTRLLRDVVWSVPDDQQARIVAAVDGLATLSGRIPGALLLTASVGATALERPLTILDTLQSISISPLNLGLGVGSTRDLVATGTYTQGSGNGIPDPPTPGGTDNGASDDIDDDGTDTSDTDADGGTADETGTNDDTDTSTGSDSQVIITDAVDWRVTGDTDLADITSGGQTPGRLTARAEGTVTVQASCGPISGTGSLTISESSSGDGSDDLSFDQDEELLSLSTTGTNRVINLRVSTGSDYDASDDVTDQASWSVTNSQVTQAGSFNSVVVTVGDQVASNGQPSTKGQVTAQTPGTATIQATFGGDTATINVRVTN